MIDGIVQIFQAEHDPRAFPKISDTVERVPGLQPHRGRRLMGHDHRQSLVVEAGAVQVETRDTELRGDRQGLLGGA